MPLAAEMQALLPAVAQMAFVVAPAADHALAQAQLFQQVMHLVGVVAGQGEVVRTRGQGQAVDLARAAVAAGLSSSSSSTEVVLPRQAQRRALPPARRCRRRR